MRTVARLSTCPVKGFALVNLDEVRLEEVGIAQSRRFLAIDGNGRHLGAWAIPELLTIEASFDPEREELELRFPDGAIVRGMADDLGEPIVTSLSRRKVSGRVVEGPFTRALSVFTGRALRLLRLDRDGDGPDVHPVTLLSSASVEELARRASLPTPLDSRRFRMNVEIDGCAPHEEDTWEGRTVRIGEAVVRVLGQVPRCIVTTKDPSTGRKDIDTLKAIASYRPSIDRSRGGPGLPFGTYAEVEIPGVVRVGDAVDPLE